MPFEKAGPNHLFQKTLSARISGALAEANAVGILEHQPTVGQLREFGFGRLLQDVLPGSFSVGTGIIQDCDGNESSQTDLIVWDRASLPPILFSENTGVFPVESCYYAIEVKSKSTRQHIEETLKKADRLRGLKYLANYDGLIKGHPAVAYFAYESDLSKTSEFDRYRELDPTHMTNPRISILCIVGDGYYVHTREVDPRTGQTSAFRWLKFKPDKEHYEVIGLLSGIANTLTGRRGPDLGYYLLYPEGDARAEIIDEVLV